MMVKRFDKNPVLIMGHRCNVDVYMLASELIKQLQKLIDEHGDGNVDYDEDYDGNRYLEFRSYRMETPKEAKIRYDKEIALHKKDMEREKETYERLKKKYG
jgi:hypothetical protein